MLPWTERCVFVLSLHLPEFPECRAADLWPQPGPILSLSRQQEPGYFLVVFGVSTAPLGVCIGTGSQTPPMENLKYSMVPRGRILFMLPPLQPFLPSRWWSLPSSLCISPQRPLSQTFLALDCNNKTILMPEFLKVPQFLCSHVYRPGAHIRNWPATHQLAILVTL